MYDLAPPEAPLQYDAHAHEVGKGQGARLRAFGWRWRHFRPVVEAIAARCHLCSSRMAESRER